MALTDEEKKAKQAELDNSILGSVKTAYELLKALGDDSDEESINKSSMIDTVNTILRGLTHKVSPKQINDLVEDNVVTDAFRDYVMAGAQAGDFKFIKKVSKGTSTSSGAGGGGLDREFPAKFEKYNPANEKAETPDPQMIEHGKTFQLKLRKFLTGTTLTDLQVKENKEKPGTHQEPQLDSLSVEEETKYFLTKGEDLMTYFRTVKDDEVTDKAEPAKTDEPEGTEESNIQ